MKDDGEDTFTRRLRKDANKRADSFPLTRLTRCTCGAGITASFSRSERSGPYGYYFCPKCHVRICWEILETQVADLLRTLAPTADDVRQFSAELAKAEQRRPKSAQADVVALERPVVRCERKLEELENAYIQRAVNERIDAETYQRRRRVYQAELSEVRRELQTA